jgi:hypothetical protein
VSRLLHVVRTIGKVGVDEGDCSAVRARATRVQVAADQASSTQTGDSVDAA